MFKNFDQIIYILNEIVAISIKFFEISTEKFKI